jgi:predicted nucleotidyltransferase
MKRDDAIAILRPLEPTLRSQGIAHLYLFGSVARDEAKRGSDVDLAFDVEPGVPFNAFDQSRIYMDLTEALRTRTNFVERDMLSAVIAKYVAPDLIQIF